MRQPPSFGVCEHCGLGGAAYPFCQRCAALRGQTDSSIVRATRLRRLSGAILELILMTVTLLVGWLIWLAFTARNSQTPAKQLLGMYILTEDGVPASAGRVWLREIVIEGLLFGFVGSFFVGLTSLLDALWILWDPNHQTLHDKVAGTLVVHAREPNTAPPESWDLPIAAPQPHRAASLHSSSEEQLRELKTLLDDDLISAVEYRATRERILDRI